MSRTGESAGAKVSLVLFDLDGVIVSTDRLHYVAWKAMADSRGLCFSQEFNHRLRGVSRAESLRIILAENDVAVSDREFGLMTAEKNDLYRTLLDDMASSDVLPGSVRLIDELKDAGVRVGIGSSSKNAPLILSKIALAEQFDVIIDGNCITESKPDPQVFSKGAIALGVDPSECVVFEDAQSGIEAALRAGMVAVGVGNRQLIGAHHMVRDLAHIDYHVIASVHEAATGGRTDREPTRPRSR